jgi:hypothetical protein
MTADVKELEARLAVVEGEGEGEKIVTRYILEQTRRNGDDLAAVKSRLDRVETRLGRLEQKLDALGNAFDGFRRDLPKIVGQTMREVLRERDK